MPLLALAGCLFSCASDQLHVLPIQLWQCCHACPPAAADTLLPPQPERTVLLPTQTVAAAASCNTPVCPLLLPSQFMVPYPSTPAGWKWAVRISPTT